jgi:hypothetical protein
MLQLKRAESALYCTFFSLPAAPNATTTAVAQALNPKLALHKAFHHILTNSTHKPTAPSPACHHVAMGLLQHAALVPCWELPDTMYTASAPAPRENVKRMSIQ